VPKVNPNMTGVFGPDSSSRTLSGAPEIRSIAFGAPLGWLTAGWRDLWSAPHISLAYGVSFSLAAYVFAFVLVQNNALPLLLPLGGGFLLMGPMLAAGLYEVSRRRERGEAISYRDILPGKSDSTGQLAFFGALLLILYFFWIRVALLLFMLFFGPADFPPVREFIPTLFSTGHGLSLLLTGTAVGAVFAALTYAISAISVPMLLDRKMDAVTAMSTSVRAVWQNWLAMGLWAVLIVALSALGLATLFVGLAITFPLIGHATWHAYRELTR